jgi:hypothetical protein
MTHLHLGHPNYRFPSPLQQNLSMHLLSYSTSLAYFILLNLKSAMISDNSTHQIYNTSLENHKNKHQQVQCDRGVRAQAHTYYSPVPSQESKY